MRRQGALIAVAGALALAGCQPAERAKPPMWTVSDGDTTVWLVGSMHLLPPGTVWRTEPIEQAIKTADTLVLETDPTADQGFDALARDPSLPPLDKRIDPAKADALAKAIGRTGQPAEAFAHYKDWAVAVALERGDADDAGATARDGVDKILWDTFAKRKRLGLEPPGAQLHAIDLLPAQLQRRMLDTAIAAPSYESAFAAWRDGDLAALDKAAGSKELRPFLVTTANRRWASWIAGRMGQPGKVLIAVGAGHLVGDDSIVALLKANGLKVDRVQ